MPPACMPMNAPIHLFSCASDRYPQRRFCFADHIRVQSCGTRDATPFESSTTIIRRQSQSIVELIDYQDVVRRYSFAEHARQADAYFASFLHIDSLMARKPFAGVEEAGELCAGIGALLPGLRLFSGARVLDFGAGTCWLSKILALLGCEVVAVDVSGTALDIGRQLMQRDTIGAKLRVDYVRLDSASLPFPKASFDRIVCFDALHHVPDQRAAISEFSRVLKSDGIGALHEPGPEHSQGAQSQYEMRNYGVIEADIHIEDLISHAQACGFRSAKMALYSVRPLLMEINAFNGFLDDRGASSPVARELASAVRVEFLSRRVCFLGKGDPDAHADSRFRNGLRAEFALTAEQQAGSARIRGSIRNAGSSTWLPSPAGVGEVNIGVHLQNRDGILIDLDYARRELAREPVAPGATVDVDFVLPYPAGHDGFCLVIDLVAEHVGWFELGSGGVFKVRIDRDAKAKGDLLWISP